jgi:hypothetical protein
MGLLQTPRRSSRENIPLADPSIAHCPTILRLWLSNPNSGTCSLFDVASTSNSGRLASVSESSSWSISTGFYLVRETSIVLCAQVTPSYLQYLDARFFSQSRHKLQRDPIRTSFRLITFYNTLKVRLLARSFTEFSIQTIFSRLSTLRNGTLKISPPLRCLKSQWRRLPWTWDLSNITNHTSPLAQTKPLETTISSSCGHQIIGHWTFFITSVAINIPRSLEILPIWSIWKRLSFRSPKVISCTWSISS